LVFDIGNTSDSIQVNGNLALSWPTIGIQLVPGGSLTLGQLIPLIHYSGVHDGQHQSISNPRRCLPGFALKLIQAMPTPSAFNVSYVPCKRTGARRCRRPEPSGTPTTHELG